MKAKINAEGIDHKANDRKVMDVTSLSCDGFVLSREGN